ncbi:hypothetical protein HMI56_003636 [Coelomomyces lativittatus]|nr:hypothetical protein HMI56_003636 [Coelomomyces lativittatus]
MTTTSTSLRVQDASLAGGYRVAGRKLIRVYLETCFRFEETTPLSCFDVHDVASLVCFCTGKGAHLWSFSKRQWICTFGKTSAGHRSSIVSCQLSPSGLYLITGGEDHRVVLWHISKQSAEK